jgi:hypothetical protein
MKKTYLIALLALLFIAGILWYRFGKPSTPQTNNTTVATTTTTQSGTVGNSANASGTKGANVVISKYPLTYTNSEYNFSIRYPKSITTEYPFKSSYHLGKDWRAGATPEYRGTPIIALIVYREDNQTVFPKKYPLYFSTEIRIGVSKDTKNCYQKDAGYENQKITTVTFNGITWKKFSFADAGMMQYGEGESYRTIHNNICYAVEQVKTGSTYRDNTMATGTPDKTLNAYYAATTDILKTFQFTK